MPVHLKDKKITILQQVIITDPDGFETKEWRPIAGGENIWAYYRQASGQEFYTAAQTDNKVEAIFEINWRNDLTPDMRIVYNSTPYNITRIDDYEGYKDTIRIEAATTA